MGKVRCLRERFIPPIRNVTRPMAEGRLEDEHWRTIENQAISFGHLPGLEAAWKLRGHWYSPEFQAWFEGLRPHDVPGAYER